MNVPDRIMPDLIIYVGAESEEPAQRIVTEIRKILVDGRSGMRKDGDYVIVPVPLDMVLTKDAGTEHLNVCVVVYARGSKEKARWFADNIRREMAVGKIDDYFRQFKAGWASHPMSDEEAESRGAREVRAQRDRVARQAAGPS